MGGHAPLTPDEAMCAFGQSLREQETRLAAERSERISASADRAVTSRLGPLWLVAKAVAQSQRRYLAGRPSKATAQASYAAGYVEGLRDAACALLQLDAGELSAVLDKANEGLDTYGARNQLHRPPNMTLSSHLRP